ncbi:MAG: LemA family protein [Planctomycetota bacterium]|nr:LemA family protein [Planctomycetota bacterium]
MSDAKAASTSPISGVFQVLTVIVLLITAFILRGCSMDGMRGVLEVQRTPVSYAAGLVDGPSMITAKVRREDAILRSRLGAGPVVYFDWIKEREETDSDGDSTWVTVDSASGIVNFSVDDATGSLLVKAQTDDADLYPTSMPTKRYGNYRETETVIKADAEVLVLGEYNLERGSIGNSQDHHGVRFTISTRGESAILSGRGWTSVGMMAMAVFAFVFAVGFVLNLMRVHHIMMASFAVLVSLPTILLLQWMLVTAEQLSLANERVMQYQSIVENQDPPNDATTLLRNALIKRDAIRVQELYQQYRNRYTNIAHAVFMSLDDVQMRTLGDEEISILRSYPLHTRVGTVLNPFIVVVLGISGLVVMAILGFIGYRKMGTKRMIENIPTTKVKGVVPGMTEVVGKIQVHETLFSGRYSGDGVVYCKYLKERYQKSGKNSRWVTVASGVQQCLFEVQDETGNIPVNSEDAEVHARRTYFSRVGRLRYSEWTLRPDQEIYVLGPAVLDNPTDQNLTIQKSRDERHFVISDQGEESIMLKYARVGLMILGTALSCCIVAVMTLYGGASFDTFGYFAGALVAVMFLIVLNIGFLFNDLVFVRNWQQRGKSNLDVSLKRRADLIPNLVRVVSEALEHERGLQVALADLRGSGGEQPVGAMHQRFMALLENYPDLNGNEVIVDLNNRIVAVENQLQYARTGYNAVTQQYNSRVRQIPEVFLAKLMRFRTKSYFQLQHANEGNAVDVGQLLQTADEKKAEAIQREKDEKLALISDSEIMVATLVCLMAVDGDIGADEYGHMQQFVSTSAQGIGKSELRKIAQTVLDRIEQEGLNSVLSTTIEQVERLAGTAIGQDLIQAMNFIAELGEGVEESERALVDRFRDVLGGEKDESLELVSDGEIIVATLLCLMTADGDIGADEYRAMEQFVSTSTQGIGKSELRKIAETVLDRIKRQGLDAVISTTIEQVKRLAGTQLGKDLIQTINSIAEMGEGVKESEQALVDRFRDGLGGGKR